MQGDQIVYFLSKSNDHPLKDIISSNPLTSSPFSQQSHPRYYRICKKHLDPDTYRKRGIPATQKTIHTLYISNHPNRYHLRLGQINMKTRNSLKTQQKASEIVYLIYICITKDQCIIYKQQMGDRHRAPARCRDWETTYITFLLCF